MTGEDSAAVWTDIVPEAIHNPVAIKENMKLNFFDFSKEKIIILYN